MERISFNSGIEDESMMLLWLRLHRQWRASEDWGVNSFTFRSLRVRIIDEKFVGQIFLF